jgi:hypothetical protein
MRSPGFVYSLIVLQSWMGRSDRIDSRTGWRIVVHPPVSLCLSPVLLALACEFPRPADVLDDAASGEGQPESVVLVSTTGDDVHDGLTVPVRTLKRAIGLATANDLITTISLAAGRYSSATGESFPYTVPSDVTIAGPVGGGAVLAGTDTEQGLMVASGGLRDLELEDFTVAVTGSGSAELTNLRIRSSTLALRGEASSRLMVDRFDVTGPLGGCATGIELNADADLKANEVSTRALSVSFHLKDRSTSSLTRANVVADNACNPGQVAIGALTVTTTHSFELRDSIIDGGTNGVVFLSTGTRTTAILANTTIRNVTGTSIIGRRVSFAMTGGELSGGNSGLDVRDSNGQIINAIFKQYQNVAISIGDDAALTMRNCTITAGALGIYLYASTAALDLGTVASRGNNVIQNQSTGIHMDPGSNQLHVEAVGNTWIPDLQGADAEGHYPSMRLVGPVSAGTRGNFDFPASCSLHL